MEETDNHGSKTFTYLALGDSYTIGQGVSENLRWPNQIKARLRDSNKSIDKVDIIAQTGWTTNDLLTAISKENPEDHNIVSLLIGVNNQYQGLPFSQFETELDSLLKISIKLADEQRRVFVVSIPDYSVTPFVTSNRVQIAEDIDNYNHHIEDRCHELGIQYINITEISREMGNDDNALTQDGLHPSGYQYDRWVEEILPFVLKLIE